jgi:cytochrome b6-f complex iron-sulfur subunit
MTTEQTTSHDNRPGPSRRTVLVLGAAGVSTVALAACSKAKTSGSSGTTPPATTPATSVPGTSSTPASGGQALAKLSDVPVGGAISAKDADGAEIIITRPTDTTVAAFTAICTHQGCTVKPGSDRFVCPCHGSVYDAKTGDRISGPARGGLSKVNVQVSGQDIVAG